MIDVVILCGGRGTRSVNPNLPKCLQVVGNFTLLERQLRCLPRDANFNVILVGGWQFNQVVSFLNLIQNNYPNINFICYQELNPNGTLDALRSAIPYVRTDSLIVVLGDLFISADLTRYVDYYSRNKPEVLLLTHPNDHPKDSDLVHYSSETLKVKRLIPKKRVAHESDGNMAIAGIAIMRTEVCKRLNSLSGDWIESLFTDEKIPNFDIEIFPTLDPIHDSGTPERLDYLSRRFRFSSPHKKIICLDFDDTLIPNIEIKNSSSSFRIADEVAKQIRVCNEIGIGIFVLTNQPGIAKGFFDFEDFDDFRQLFEGALAEWNAKIDRWFVCPHHPLKGFFGENVFYKARCLCRKPNPGFASQIYSEYFVEPKDCIMIGNSDSDMHFAKNANMLFFRASLSLQDEVGQNATSLSIRKAASILC